MKARELAEICDALSDPADETIRRNALRQVLGRLASEFRAPVIALCDYHPGRRVIDAVHLRDGELLDEVPLPGGTRIVACTPRLPAGLWAEMAIRRARVLERADMERRSYPTPELLAWYGELDHRGWLELPLAGPDGAFGKLSLMQRDPHAPGLAGAVVDSLSFRVLRALWCAGRRRPARGAAGSGESAGLPRPGRRAIRVLLADDHPIFLEAVVGRLRQERGIEVVATERSGAAAIAAYDATRPDVVLMDLQMTGIDGLEATRRILARDPHARVLMLTAFGGADLVAHATEAGARGFLLKGGRVDELITGIRALAAGRTFFGGGAQEMIGLALGRPRLSPREQEILPLLATGRGNKELARALGVSEETVKDRLRTLFRKFSVHSRMELVRHAAQIGLLRSDLAG